MNVLIVKKAALGDVLRTTSLLPALRAAGARPVTWVTAKSALPLLEGHPDIARVLPSGARLARSFDLALSLEEDLDCARWAARACRGKLVGVVEKDGKLSYTPDTERYYGMSLLAREANGSLEEANRRKAANVKTYAEIWLDILGLKKPKGVTGPRLYLTDPDRRAARAVARARRWAQAPIGLNAGAGGRWPSKQLTVEAAVSLGKGLLSLGRPLLLLGGEEEKERNAKILAALPAGSAAAHDPVSLRQFAGLVELCDGLVVTDSLAFHIAVGLDKPVVALVGPTSSAELDAGARGVVLTPPNGCGCFYLASCRRAVHCLSEIPAERVALALADLMR